MSFEKADKASGNRHKARVCALHMLFACDCVGSANFESREYWGEFGYEEFQKGANELVWAFFRESEKLGKSLASLYTLLRQIDPWEQQSFRVFLKQIDKLVRPGTRRLLKQIDPRSLQSLRLLLKSALGPGIEIDRGHPEQHEQEHPPDLTFIRDLLSQIDSLDRVIAGLEKPNEPAGDSATNPIEVERKVEYLSTFLKQADGPDREDIGVLLDLIEREAMNRSENLRELAAVNHTVLTEYRRFIRSVTDNISPSAVRVHQSISDFRSLFGKFRRSLPKFNDHRDHKKYQDDIREIEDLCLRIESTTERLEAQILAKVELMVYEVTPSRNFADLLALGAIEKIDAVDDRIRTRAEHWRIERMAIVDRNVLRLAVYEFIFEKTPHTVVINEALELTRKFSSFEATQFINGILDAIKLDAETAAGENPVSRRTAKSAPKK